MNEKCLYRGKQRAGSGEWVVGYYIYIGYTNEEKHYIIPYFASALYCIEIDPATIRVNLPTTVNLSVRQCTGLRDKNGELIFEGDVVKYSGDELLCKYLAVVKYGYEQDKNKGYYHGGFHLDWFNDDNSWFFRADINFWIIEENIEVIGNIYENPELFESEAQ